MKRNPFYKKAPTLKKIKLNECCKKDNMEEWDCFCSFGCDLCWASYQCKTCHTKFALEHLKEL